MLNPEVIESLSEANQVLSSLVVAVQQKLNESRFFDNAYLSDDVLHSLDYAINIASEMLKILEDEYVKLGGKKIKQMNVETDNIVDAVVNMDMVITFLWDMEKFVARYESDPLNATGIAYNNMLMVVSLLRSVRKFVAWAVRVA